MINTLKVTCLPDNKVVHVILQHICVTQPLKKAKIGSKEVNTCAITLTNGLTLQIDQSEEQIIHLLKSVR